MTHRRAGHWWNSRPTVDRSALRISYTKGVPASLPPLGENLRGRVSAPFFSVPQTKAWRKPLFAGPRWRDRELGASRAAFSRFRLEGFIILSVWYTTWFLDG